MTPFGRLERDEKFLSNTTRSAWRGVDTDSGDPAQEQLDSLSPTRDTRQRFLITDGTAEIPGRSESNAGRHRALVDLRWAAYGRQGCAARLC